ncbi:hypothetical protein ABMA27_005149 [Loxostege sticticalis]|uniref:Kazal-like domain-containing protein n=1 Tax=Loxostege sticticalis TaxID=481309 RepID=A0ABR3HLY7_LOXSC
MDYKYFNQFFIVALLCCACAYTEVPSCACARVYRPLCASDGRTYNNLCEFQCRADYLAKFGEKLAVIKHARCEESYE